MLTSAVAGPSGLANKVPRVTVDFWIIKLMAVTVGETAADYLAINLDLGLTSTAIFMVGLLSIALGIQFTRWRYVPIVYWSAVVLISVVGTLITDILTDDFAVPLQASTLGFTLALWAIFSVWYAAERSLSIHTIFTVRREIFYWFAILFTFALGTAAGDLVAEVFGLGYLATGGLFAAVIIVIGLAYVAFKMNGILAFWLAYIFTRPLGASFGDLLAQPADYGGLGFGTTITSLLFLAAIAIVIGYMTVTSREDPS